MRRPSFTVIVAVLLCPASRVGTQVAAWRATGSGDTTSFGKALGNAGDMNGDGADDLWIGAPHWSRTTAFYEGRATLHDGRTGAILRTHDGTNVGDRFGWSFALLSDEDGDGAREYAIGALQDDTRANDGGAVFVHDGKSGAFLRSIHGTVANLWMGEEICGIADVSGDGLDDLLVGHFRLARADVWDASGTIVATLSGTLGDQFGSAPTRVGDIDGDGIDDFAIGAPWAGSGFAGFRQGIVSFYSPTTLALLGTIKGPGGGCEMGRQIARLQDIDGDRYDDLLFGMPNATGAPGVFTGLLLLASGSNLSNLRTVAGADKGDQFGARVAGLSDVDGDQVPDYAVAATTGGAGDHYRIEVRSGADDHVLWSVEGASTSTSGDSGLSMTLAPGDWNGDGTRDLAGGFPYYRELDPASGAWPALGLVTPWLSAVPIAASYGLGWPGTFGTPFLTALTTPMLGSTLDVHAAHTALGTTTALLLVGTAPAANPWRDGVILVQPDVASSYFTHAPGGTTFSEDVPDDPALAMLDLYLQVAAADAGASRGVSFTPGLHLRIGWDYP